MIRQTDTNTDGHKHRQTQTQTDTNTDSQTQTHTHKHRQTHTQTEEKEENEKEENRRRRKIVAGGRDGTDIEGSTSGHRGPKNREGKGGKHLENISKKRNRRTMLEKEKVEKIDSSKK